MTDPTPSRRTRRRGLRRARRAAIATLLFAGTLTGVLQRGQEQADAMLLCDDFRYIFLCETPWINPWDQYCDPFFYCAGIPIWIPAPGATPTPPAPAPPGLTPTDVTEKARSDAIAALAKPECRALISRSGPDGKDGQEAAQQVEIFVSETPDPTDTATDTTYAYAYRGIAIMRVFPAFTGPIDWEKVKAGLFDDERFTRTPTAEQIRTAIFLHEIAHVTQANTHPENDADGAFNVQILITCLGFVERTPGNRVIGGGRK